MYIFLYACLLGIHVCQICFRFFVPSYMLLFISRTNTICRYVLCMCSCTKLAHCTPFLSALCVLPSNWCVRQQSVYLYDMLMQNMYADLSCRPSSRRVHDSRCSLYFVFHFCLLLVVSDIVGNGLAACVRARLDAYLQPCTHEHHRIVPLTVDAWSTIHRYHSWPYSSVFRFESIWIYIFRNLISTHAKSECHIFLVLQLHVSLSKKYLFYYIHTDRIFSCVCNGQTSAHYF